MQEQKKLPHTYFSRNGQETFSRKNLSKILLRQAILLFVNYHDDIFTIIVIFILYILFINT